MTVKCIFVVLIVPLFRLTKLIAFCSVEFSLEICSIIDLHNSSDLSQAPSSDEFH